MRRQSLSVAALAATYVVIALSVPALHADGPPSGPVLTGQAAFTDYTKQKPGVRRHITAADLPAPYASKGVDNGAPMVKRPDGAMPQAPEGFKVSLYTTGLDQPRLIRTAPNGDLFVAVS